MNKNDLSLTRKSAPPVATLLAKDCTRVTNKIYDLIGVGVGPSNLALAALIHERNIAGEPKLDCQFLEAQDNFNWHPGMQTCRARIQTPFVKDLATQVDPASQFTFLKYLSESGRLEQFIELHSFYPSRKEFADYFSWAARKLKKMIRYSIRVDRIEPVFRGKSFDRLCVSGTQGRDDIPFTAHTRNLSLGIGQTQRMPEYVPRNSNRFVHSSGFLPGLKTFAADRTAPLSFAVVGGGQSAAEIVAHLLDRYPNATIDAYSRAKLFKGIDATSFVNSLYSETGCQDFFHLPEEGKQRVSGYLSNSNYGVVSADVIDEIFARLYEENLDQKSRLRLHDHTHIQSALQSGDQVKLTTRSEFSGNTRNMRFDLAIFATGYSRQVWPEMLKGMADLIDGDLSGAIPIDACRAVLLKPGIGSRIYLQGYGEESHGLAEASLAGLRPRAQKIADQLADIAINNNASLQATT